MTEAAQRLKTELAALPLEDRAELAHFLPESLEGDQDPDWDVAWKAELDRRWKEIESGRVQGVPADEVIRQLREKYS